MNNGQSIFNTLCIYGATATGKTREIGAMALYVYQRYGLRTRLISADGGGWGSIQDYIDSGLIEALNISDSDTPLPLIRRLSRGDWLVAGKWLTREQQPTTDWSGVGMYAIEGFASIASLVLRDQVAKGRKISEDLAARFVERDEDTNEEFTFGAPARAHYGFAQNTILDMIRDFQALTNHGVKQILFTSLESSGEDSLSRKKLLGPASAGNALTQILPQRVGDLIHLDIVSVTEGKLTRDEYRAYFANHVDPDVNRAWPAKLRLGAEASLAAKKDPGLAKGFIPLTDETGVTREGISRLFKWRDSISASGVEKLKQLLQQGNNR